MIFQELSRIKRQMTMSAIIFMVLGILMIICPEPYVVSMIGALGSIMLVFAFLGILEYLDSNKSVVDYITLTVNLIIGIAGTAIIIFEIYSLYAISILFGVFLILVGIVNILNAYIYGRRSGRKGWWIMIILSLVLAAFGILVLVHPNVDSVVALFDRIGLTLLFSAAISILHLIWIWPVKSE